MGRRAGEPKRLEIVTGSSAHGASILARHAAARKAVLAWLEQRLR